MSSLWTPGGERPIRPAADQGAGAPPSQPSPYPPGGRGPGGDAGGSAPTEEEIGRHVAELREQLARTPVDVVVANHAYGLFELAALHLSLEPPQLEQARLAIDAFGSLVEGLGPRLGEPAEELAAGLAQLRIAFVQVSAAARAAAEGSSAGQDAAGG